MWIFNYFFAVSATSLPGLGVFPHQGLLWGQIQQRESPGRTRIKGFPPPRVQKLGFFLSCFEVHSDERYFEFFPLLPQKKIKLNQGVETLGALFECKAELQPEQQPGPGSISAAANWEAEIILIQEKINQKGGGGFNSLSVLKK